MAQYQAGYRGGRRLGKGYPNDPVEPSRAKSMRPPTTTHALRTAESYGDEKTMANIRKMSMEGMGYGSRRAKLRNKRRR